MRRVLFILTTLFMAFSSAAAAAERKPWQQFTHCKYVEAQYNDGDSFRVNCNNREFILRLYYVDAPEADLSNAERVAEQRAYFGVTIEDIFATGEKATQRTREILQQPFTVSTRWASAMGRSAEPRFFELIEVGGKHLIEVLLAEGLARTKGVVANLPTGERSKKYREKLRNIERQAQDQRRGAWEHSKKSLRVR